ncbi:prepilin-type N-terminal cleavage/methylation domain-containing protein [Patescibacteria group bacterium]|nr:prepilin-type N-terminal cleavage/methylation domain-containing protein [Patescibacteria group bacterium]
MHFDFRNFSLKKKNCGFTVIEMVIVLGIITAIAGVVLVSFPALNENIYLQKNAQDVSLLIRKAQGRAFAQGVAQSGTCAGRVPSGYGVQLKLNSASYVLFADCDGDKKLTSGEEIQTQFFDDSLVVSQFTDLNGTPYSGYPKIDVVFSFAFANPINAMNIALVDGSNIPSAVNGLKIILQTPRTNLTKTILIVNTGQISIQ